MSWASAHRVSAELAERAHDALRLGEHETARQLFAQAASAESEALENVSLDRPRTFGITAVSAVALWYKARELETAEKLACRMLAASGLPGFAVDELRSLLQSVWNERAQEQAGVSFVPGQVIVSVKGGEVISGGAPLDLVVEKVQTVQALFYRTAEFLRGIPLRRRGPPVREIQELCRPWLFQSVPGSYQFAVAIQGPRQADLFEKPHPEPREVASVFLSILKASVDDPAEGLTRVVPDKEYKATFLKLTRNLAPSGRLFNQLEIRSADDPRPIVLSPESRKTISNTLREGRPVDDASSGLQSVTLQGVLRALDLNKDWLEITVDSQTLHISGVGETIDDVIGPLVNHQVTVQATRDAKGRYRFRDVELDE